jgi:uncharacterized protein (TIGR02757 family)
MNPKPKQGNRVVPPRKLSRPQPTLSPSIKQSLETLYLTYDKSYLDTDPLRFAHRYSHPLDREVAAFLAAVFSYGQVGQIQTTLTRLFLPFPTELRKPLTELPLTRLRTIYRDFSYRFQNADDLIQLLGLLQQTLREYGSVENSFLPHYLPVKARPDAVRVSLSSWVCSLRDRLPARRTSLSRDSNRGLFHLLADPSTGSPCKRWNLYLRWMVRGPDGMDLGLWKSVGTHQLILPLDTHTARISRYLGFTERTSPSWAMAEEITDSLRELDPEDPVRYDFSMARLGILNLCSKREKHNHCASCPLEKLCRKEHSPSRVSSEGDGL